MFSTIANAPQKQSVGETIAVLSGRLNSATLLEDRRGAILGLRSFAKDYPASVASGALRSLIGSLSKDGEDVDTVKVVLETLLMLFNPNRDSPEASEDIALWLADEFTQRQENVTLLLDFLETNDFYSRLYSLQLLSAVLSARADRTEACVFAAPLGISSLVAVLEDRREAVRNEAVSLLTYLTPTSPDIQKAIAFQGAFQRIFTIIAAEGGLSEGDRIVEDCLVLLVNLLRLNPSNQYTFREEGFVANLSQLLKSTYEVGKDAEEMAQWAQQQGSRNAYALLAILRLFLSVGEKETALNQKAFWQHGVLYHALQLAFAPSADVLIRAEALSVCASIVRGNRELQEGFAQLQVPSVLPNDINGMNGKTNGISVTLVYVIDGLLDLTLSVTALQLFDLRMAACECLQAYFYDHDEIRLHFLHRAIEGYKSGSDETANVLTTLLQPSASASNDPYRHWFAAVVLLHLLSENDDFKEPKVKALAMSLTEGDAESGEEVVTSIQTITAHLLSGIKAGIDERIIVGYLMLLIGWLWHNPAGVDDFLGEGSHLQGLTGVVQEPKSNTLIRGLCAMLLGIIYEYSTRESPIPRASLQEALLSRMSRGNYRVSLRDLLKHPLVRDFEVLPQKADDSGELPEVFFDAHFVDFYKDHCSHVLRVIDTDPSIETSVVINGEEKGVSRQLVDDLRAEVEAARTKQDEYYQNWQSTLMDGTTSSKQLGQQLENTAAELHRIKALNEALHRNHEGEIKTLQRKHEDVIKSSERKHEESLRSLSRRHDDEAKTSQRKHEQESKSLQRRVDQLESHNKVLEIENKDVKQKFGDALRAVQRLEEQLKSSEDQAAAKVAEIQRQLDYVKKTSEAEAARKDRRVGAEMAELRATISRFEVDILKANKAHSEELQTARKETDVQIVAVAEAEKRAQMLSAQLQEVQETAHTTTAQLQKRLQELENVHTSHIESLETSKNDELEQLRSQLEQKYNGELEKLKAQLATTESELKKAKSQPKQQKNDELEKVKSQLKKSQDELSNSKSLLKKKEDELENSKSQSKKQTDDGLEKIKLQLKEAEADLQKARSQSAKLEKELEDAKTQAKKPDAELQKVRSQLGKKEDEVKQRDAELKAKEEEKAATQTELDDLLMVFGDLEEKVEKYKKQVEELGGAVSEAEDDDDEDDEDDDDDVD